MTTRRLASRACCNPTGFLDRRSLLQLVGRALGLLPDYDGRYDFLALNSDALLVIVEIKRADHPATLEEVNRLTIYQDKLSLGHAKTIKMVFICGRNPKINPQALESLKAHPHFEIRFWNQLFERTRRLYEHYRAVLVGSVNDPSFKAKEEEVLQTRELLTSGIRRGPEVRSEGIPAQDVNFAKELKAEPAPPRSPKS